MTEGAIAPGRTGIVATPSQADELRADGLRRHPARQGEHGDRAPRLAAGIPLADPDLGLRRLPAVRAQAGAVPDDVLGRGRRRRRSRSSCGPTTTRSRPPTRRWSSASSTASRCNGTDLVAYKVTAERQHDRRRRQAGRDVPRRAARPRVDLGRGRAPRLPVLPRPHRPTPPRASRRSSRRPRRGSSRSSTRTATTTRSRRAARACGARTCATTTATARSQTGDGIDTNRNFSEKWRYDNEGASDSTTQRHLPRPVAGVRARGASPSTR